MCASLHRLRYCFYNYRQLQCHLSWPNIVSLSCCKIAEYSFLDVIRSKVDTSFSVVMVQINIWFKSFGIQSALRITQGALADGCHESFSFLALLFHCACLGMGPHSLTFVSDFANRPQSGAKLLTNFCSWSASLACMGNKDSSHIKIKAESYRSSRLPICISARQAAAFSRASQVKILARPTTTSDSL